MDATPVTTPFEQIIDYAASWGLSRADVVAHLRKQGKSGYSPARDEKEVVGWIAANGIQPEASLDEAPPPDDEPKALALAEVHENLPTPSYMQPDQIPDLDKAEAGISLAPKYMEFENEGQTIRAVFCGFNSMQNQQGNAIPVAVFQTKEQVFVNAGANLVQQVKNIPPRTPVQITYTGKQKTKSGNNVKCFDVRLLKV